MVVQHQTFEKLDPASTLPEMGSMPSVKCFAECQMLCRVSFIGHSAKRLFAKRRSRQSKTLGKDCFAECRALGKEMHSVKKVFAESPTPGKDLHSAKTTFPTRRVRRSGAGVRRSSSSVLWVCLHRVTSPLHRLTTAPLA